MQPKYLLFGTLALALLLQITPAHFQAWTLTENGLVQVHVHPGLTPLEPVTRSDFNGDGEPESISILHQVARITSAGTVLWHSPESWRVLEARITDLDHDGVPEAALLVWRPFRPWPVDQWLPQGGRIGTFHDAQGESCHLILIGWQKGGFHELWAGSALAEPVRSFFAVDLDDDGWQELVTLEGSYADPRSAPARALEVWEWNGFGFSNVYTLKGRFDALAAARSDNGQTLILAP